jgi:hypothetical protein
MRGRVTVAGMFGGEGIGALFNLVMAGTLSIASAELGAI